VSVHDQTTQAAFLDAEQVRRGPLPEVVSMEPILEGVPFAHEKTVFDGADGFFAIWACGAGVFPRVKDKRGSFMYILSGDATIVDQDGTSHELTADSALVLPFGWVGTWHSPLAASSRSRAAGQAPGTSAVPCARSACAAPPRLGRRRRLI
jgi:uncharacterized cupin superfamily protein